MGIRNKLMLLVLLASLVPMLLFGALAIGTAGQVIENEILSGSRLYTTMTKTRLESFFHAREGDGRLLASSRILRENLEVLNAFAADREEKARMADQFHAFLSQAIVQYGYTDLFLTNGYGEVVHSQHYQPLDLAPLVASREETGMALSGRQTWSELFWNSFVKDNILVLSACTGQGCSMPTLLRPLRAPPIGSACFISQGAALG